MFCTRCGSEFGADHEFCSHCGAARPVAVPKQSSPASPPPPDGPDNRALYSALIGPKNAETYLRYFLEADASGKAGASWHWPGFLVPFHWFVYRKLWAYAVAYNLVPAFAILLAAIAALLTGLGEIGIAVAAMLSGLVVGIVLPAMYAKKIYYHHARGLLPRARWHHADVEGQARWLAEKGGVSIVWVWVVSILPVLVIALAAFAIPAYQDYHTRALVTEGLNLAITTKVAIAESHANTGVWPKDNAAAGQPFIVSGRYVDSIVAMENGILIHFRDADHVSEPLRGKDLYLIAGVTPDGSVVWQCGSGPVPEGAESGPYGFEESGGGGSLEQKYRPADCRG